MSIGVSGSKANLSGAIQSDPQLFADYIVRERDQGNRNVYPVYPLALLEWHSVVLTGLTEASQLSQNIVKLINEERDGVSVDSFTIKKAIDSLIILGIDPEDYTRQNLDLYNSSFLQPFLHATNNYYLDESTDFLLNNPVVNYVDKAMARLAQEQDRGNMYLHASSLSDYADTCRQALVQSCLTVLQTEFSRLLKEADEHYLGRIYQLLSLFPDSLEPLRQAYGQHLHDQGQQALVAIIPDSKEIDAIEYVNAMVDLHGNFRSIIDTCLQSDETFVAALDKVSRTRKSETKSTLRALLHRPVLPFSITIRWPASRLNQLNTWPSTSIAISNGSPSHQRRRTLTLSLVKP